MYSLDYPTYKNKSFSTVDALVEDALNSGMDPNYEILQNGEPTGELLIDFIVE